MTFLKNHRGDIAAMDFFTVPTVKFQLLYVFFVISHARRRILHFACTLNPTTGWVFAAPLHLEESGVTAAVPHFGTKFRDGKGASEMAPERPFLASCRCFSAPRHPHFDRHDEKE
ncbi:MAG TPA: hypothetical protein PLV42_02750 [bacterium]|nr:hypothetical protein [bacterium]